MDTITRPALDPAQAARLERLAARRNAAVPGEALAPPSMAPSSNEPVDVDTALADRLEKLAAARAGHGPVPPTARTTTPTKKRRHPAKHSRTAALSLSVLASGGLGFLFATTDPGATAAPAVPVGLVPAATSAASATPAPATSSTASAASGASAVTATASGAPASTATITAPATAAVATPADPVTVNGESFHNKWGDVQVQATFASDGTLTAVDAVQVPFRDGKSVRINDRAVPQLNSEALSTQSASVDTVSGATYTSVGYQQSLQSAIDIAVASGVPAPVSA